MEFKIAGYTKDHALDDAEHIRLGITRMAGEIGMTIINGPTVSSYKEISGSPDAELSGFALIAESHIAVHTWPERGYLYMEVDSCVPFDPELAKALFITHFGISRVIRQRIEEESWSPP